MSKIGDKEAAQRAMREARFNRESRQGKMLDLSGMSGGPNAAKPKKTPARLAQPKQPDGSIERPAERRKREITEMIDDATTGDFKDGPEPRSSVEVVQAATDAVIDKFAAGKVKLTIRIDRELMKEIKIDAVETDQTVEAWVEAAIRQELKTRRA
jgi:hypothetical protein